MNDDLTSKLKAFDRERLEEIMDGDEEIMRESIQLFLECYIQYSLELKKAMVNKNFNDLKRCAHKFKGSALNACAMAISDILINLEQYSESKNESRCFDFIEKLEPEHKEFINEVKKANLMK